MSKIKTYNIMLSKVFPVNHPRAGEETGFRQKVTAAFNDMPCFLKKIHTIRENYPLWEKRFMEVEKGYAVINLRQWSGRPYRSKTVLICTLTSKDGIGIQRLNFGWRGENQVPIIEGWYMDGSHGCKRELAQNDGLSLEDWQNWFKSHDKDRPTDKSLAIIHFTKFRY